MPEESQQDQNHIFPENQNPINNNSGYVPMSVDTEPENVNSGINENNYTGYQPQQPAQPINYPQQNQPVNNGYNQPPVNLTPVQQVPQGQYFDPQQSQFTQQSNSVPPQEQNIPQNQYFQTAQAPVQPPVTQPAGSKVLNKINSVTPKFKKISDFLMAKWWLVLILIIGVSVAGVGAYFYFSKPAEVTGAFDKVTATITAPQTSASGSPNKWKITLKNNESVSQQNIIVSLNYDRAFKFTQSINPDPSKPDGSEFKIARLDPAGQGSSEVIIQFEGTLTGNTDEETLMQGSVSFTPTPLLSSTDNRRTVQIPTAKTKITSPQIKVSVLPTEDTVQSGGETTVNIVFQNTSERELKDIRIRMLYPDQGGFNYVSSELQVADTSQIKTKPDDGNNIWFIPSLPRLKEQTLKIIGKVFGSDGVKVTFGVNLDIKTSNNDYITLTQTSKDIKIVSQPLTITTSIENKASDKLFGPGDTLSFVIDYKNKSTSVLKNVEILASVDDPANILDYTTTAFSGGDRGGVTNRTIQWKGTNVPKLVNLSPQDGGQLRYSIRVLDADTFIKSGLTQNTFVVTPRVSAKALNLQPVDFSGELYKGKGLLTFDQSIVSKGVDPTNTKRETFAVTWTLKSRQTQVNDVVVSTRSSLINPWRQESITPALDANKITYNDITGEIIWKPGKIPAYTGLNGNSVVSITFNLVVEAAEGGSTKNVSMFTAARTVGVDDFTAEKFTITGAEGRSQ